MLNYIKKILNADSQTKQFAIVNLLFYIIIFFTTIYVFTYILFSREYPTEKAEKHTGHHQDATIQ